MSKKYIFIIDTDSYAGNFERDMCAYVTGVVGHCGVGEEFAEMYNEDIKEEESVFLDYLEFRSDDRGCARPTKCWPTEGWLCVGDKAVRKEDWNQAEADSAYQKESADIYRGYRRLIENVTVGQNGWTEESKARELARHDREIERALKDKCPKSMPNNSVAIFFEKKPTEEMIELMKNRAYKFAEAKRRYAEQEDTSYDKNFQLTIHGFRLVEESLRRRNKKV
jgi:hypothetical protein